jgi:putative cell wall-binding protein
MVRPSGRRALVCAEDPAVWGRECAADHRGSMTAAPRPRVLPAVLGMMLLTTVLVAVPPAWASSPVDDVPPTTIRVCRYHGGVDVVPLEEYVRQVLPVEFPPSWPAETLKAGAVAIKSYAWYYIDNPISATCDIGDSTRYQKYAPEQQHTYPTPATDAAVRDTFRYRLEDATGQNLYAQYCSGGCYTHRQYSGAGNYMDQDEANALAQQGWSWVDLLMHFYRNKGPQLVDWTAPFAVVARTGELAYGAGEPAMDADFRVAGVAPGEEQAYGSLFLHCTTTGGAGPHQIQRVGVTDVGGHAMLDFAATDAADGCEENTLVVSASLYVKDRLVAAGAVGAMRPWRSSSPRQVTRAADADSAIDGAIELSTRMFDAATTQEPPAEPDDELTVPVVAPASESTAEETPDTRQATHVVLARHDVFADAMSATALAGTAGPILFTDGGPDARLSDAVRAEIDRVLQDAATIHIVGGPQSVSQGVEEELAQAGYDVRRHHGDSRTSTAVAVAETIRQRSGAVDTVLVARAYPDSSRAWADAITVGAYAAATGHPILLTDTDELPGPARTWMNDQDLAEAVVLGGTASVSQAVAAGLPADRVTRVAGDGRDSTASAIATALWSRADAPEIRGAMLMNIHDDDAWGHALAAAVLGARRGLPGLAVQHAVPIDSTGAWLDGREGLPVVLIGSSRLVADRIQDDVDGP